MLYSNRLFPKIQTFDCEASIVLVHYFDDNNMDFILTFSIYNYYSTKDQVFYMFRNNSLQNYVSLPPPSLWDLPSLVILNIIIVNRSNPNMSSYAKVAG